MRLDGAVKRRGSFACCAERDLAESADLPEQVGDFLGFGRVHGELGVFDQAAFLGERLNVGTQQFAG